MKKISFFLILFLSISCSRKTDENPKPTLKGTWRLKEFLVMDSSGVSNFQPIESDKTITFHSDGSVTSNGDLCELTGIAGFPTSGYILRNTIQPYSCFKSRNFYNFSRTGTLLTIEQFPCNDSCQVRYHKE